VRVSKVGCSSDLETKLGGIGETGRGGILGCVALF